MLVDKYINTSFRSRGDSPFRPYTRAQYLRQFKLYLAFPISRDLRICDSSACVMRFLEFLASNGMTFRVVNNYVSALKFAFATTYGWNQGVFDCAWVKRLLRGIKYSCHRQSTSKALFSLSQIREIFENTLTYKAAYLVSFMVCWRPFMYDGMFYGGFQILPPFSKAFEAPSA